MASTQQPNIARSTAVIVQIPVIGLIGLAALLVSFAPDAYQRIVQEDEFLEWATFWTFAGAAALHVRAARTAFRSGALFAWFPFGLSLFCLLVALEEISWGQRIFGFRPPDYFLSENYQQELNLHNTLGDALRQNGFLAVCWLYGVALPLLSWPARSRRMLDRFGIVGPPLELAPSFAATALLYDIYPWSHTGEWAEAMLGTAMLFAAVFALPRRGGRALGALAPLSIAWVVCLVLGVASAQIGRMAASDDPYKLERARIELAALRKDLTAARSRTRCGVHKRLYTFVEAYDLDHLRSGEFAALPSAESAAERTRFFLDPWNSPYWVQNICSEDNRRRAIFVYSFGPNRRRESTDWEIIEDDLGAWISRPRDPEAR